MSTDELQRQETVLATVENASGPVKIDMYLMDSSTHNLLQQMGYKVQFYALTNEYVVSMPGVDKYSYFGPTTYDANIYVPEGY